MAWCLIKPKDDFTLILLQKYFAINALNRLLHRCAIAMSVKHVPVSHLFVLFFVRY
jgi:hypothetical protein